MAPIRRILTQALGRGAGDYDFACTGQRAEVVRRLRNDAPRSKLTNGGEIGRSEASGVYHTSDLTEGVAKRTLDQLLTIFIDIRVALHGLKYRPSAATGQGAH